MGYVCVPITAEVSAQDAPANRQRRGGKQQGPGAMAKGEDRQPGETFRQIGQQRQRVTPAGQQGTDQQDSIGLAGDGAQGGGIVRRRRPRRSR